MIRRLSVALLAVSVAMGTVACSSDEQTATTTTTIPATPAESTGLTAIVQYAQDALHHAGYYEGASTGDIDSGTRAAIRRFQRAKDLEVTGRFDAATVKALAKASPKAETLLVEALQTELTDLGFYTGLIDGRFTSAEMTKAIRALQREAKIGVDGILGPQTFDALQRLYAESVGATPPPTTTTQPQPTTTAVASSPTTAPGKPASGSTADAQRRLAALGYRPGPADGRVGAQTASAVLAFQKREGLPRTSDLDAATRARLANPQGAGPRSRAVGPRVEIDLDRQILFFIDASGAVTTINTSTGSGATYSSGGSTATAYTPTGEFRIERRIDGIRHAPLGSLYRPLYFKQGWAIHGAAVVPAYPASHGCARTANWDQDFIFPKLPNGSQVSIYGTSKGDPNQGQPGY